MANKKVIVRKKVSDYIKLHPKQVEAYQYIGKGGRIFFGGSRGGGKLSPLDSEVYTLTGPRKMGDLKVGDRILNPDGSLQKILRIFPHKDADIYRIHFEDGASLEVGLDHLWLTRVTWAGSGIHPEDEDLNDPEFNRGYIRDTRAIIEWFDKKRDAKEGTTIKQQHMCIPLCRPLKFSVKYSRPIPPYILGVLLGDGSLGSTTANRFRYTGLDEEIDKRINELGYETIRKGKEVSILFPGAIEAIKSLGLEDAVSLTKFIPKGYQLGTLEQRIELIKGMMDTDGYVDDRGHMSYSSVSEQMAKDFQWVVRTLGCKASIKRNKAGYKDDNGDFVRCNDSFDVYFNGKMNPDLVNISRKKERCRYEFNGGVSEVQRRIVGYEYVGKKDARCIMVDHPNRLYVANDAIVTHNSYFALASGVLASIRNPGLTTVIVRETYSELQKNFIVKLIDLFPPDVFGYRYIKSDKMATFSNGSRIYFQAVDREESARKVQGIEFQFLIIDEANNHDERRLHRIFASVRSPDRVSQTGFLPTILMTGNPGGMSDYYFKTRFISPDYKVWRPYELTHKDKYIFVKSSLDDNYSLNREEYRQNLESLDEDLRKAWLLGDWNVFEGKFFAEFNLDIHVVPDFDPPREWRRSMGFDLGYTGKHPAIGLLGALDPEDNVIHIYDEYVGVGVVEDYARAISDIYNRDKFEMIFADPSMFNSTIKSTNEQESPDKMFQREGLPIVKADNNRINGWRIVKQWIHPDKNGKPKLVVHERCQNLIQHLPLLRYAKSENGVKREDLDSRMQDDAADALRYLLVSWMGYPTQSEMEYYERLAIEESKAMIDIGDDSPIHAFREGEYNPHKLNNYSRY